MNQQAATIVYRARNLVNGKSYIGYTARGLKVREQAHRNAANGTNDANAYLLHKAMKKYGRENIVFEVMYDFDGDEDLAKLYEIEAIAKYKPEYNLSYGGEGGSLHASSKKKISDANRGRKMPQSHHDKRVAFLTGRRHTPEAKEKIRQANIGRPSPLKGVAPSAETRAKISAANKGRAPWITGKTHTEETKAKIRAQRWSHSPESLARIVEARKRVWASPTGAMLEAVRANNRKALAARMLPVRCLDDGRVFAGCSDADRFYGLRIGTTSRVLKGTIQNRTGKTFEYASRGDV